MSSLISIEEKSKIKKVLVRATNWIGDAVMTTPAVATIRKNLPDAEITLLAMGWVADVFASSPHVDKIILYDKKERHKGVTGKIRLGLELRKEKFDAAILLQNAFEAAFITLLANIPIRAGYTTDGRGLLLTHGVRKQPGIDKKHQVHYYQEMLQGLGFTPAPDKQELFIADDRRQAAESFLRDKNVAKEELLVGLNPGAAYGPAKRWPAGKYGELAGKLNHDHHNITVLVFGTEADQDAAQTISSSVDPQKIINLTGKTTLIQAMALIARCNCFVTNDSGLMHVAAALQIPLVAVFGSTNHITTAPFSQKAIIVRKDLPCSPCMKTHCPLNHFQCMEKISVDEVKDQVLKTLPV